MQSQMLFAAKTEYSEKYNRWFLKKSNNEKKDQSYVLWSMPKELIEHVLFPYNSFSSPTMTSFLTLLNPKTFIIQSDET